MNIDPNKGIYAPQKPLTSPPVESTTPKNKDTVQERIKLPISDQTVLKTQFEKVRQHPPSATEIGKQTQNLRNYNIIISKLFDIIEKMKDEDDMPAHLFLDESRALAIEQILSHTTPQDVVDELVMGLFEVTEKSDRLWRDWLNIPDNMYDYHLFSSEVEAQIKDIAEKTGLALFGIKGLTIPYNGIHLIYKAINISIIEKKIALIEKEIGSDPNVPPEITKKLEVIKAYIVKSKQETKDDIVPFLLESGSYYPIALKVILEKMEIILSTDPLANVLSGAASIVALISSGLNLRKINKDVGKQEKWIQEGKPIVDKQGVEALLDKRQKTWNKRLAQNETPFNRVVEDLKKSKSFNEFQGILRKNHLNLEQASNKLIDTPEALKAYNILEKLKQHKDADIPESTFKRFRDTFVNLIEKIPKYKCILLEQYTEYEDAMAASTKNALQVMEDKKLKVESKFLKFKLTKSKIMFALTVLSTAAVLTLQVLAAVGAVAVPTFAMMIPGLGPLVMGIALFAVGLYYLHKYKPNLVKSIFKLVQFRVGLIKIPLCIQQYRLGRKFLRQLENVEKVTKVEARINLINKILDHKKIEEELAGKELKSLLKVLKKSDIDHLTEKEMLKLESIKAKEIGKRDRYLEQKNRLKDVVAALNQKVNYWKKKYDGLLEHLIEESSNDFIKTSGLDRFVGKDGKGNKLASPGAVYDILTEGLMEGKWSLDEDKGDFLQHRLGIDIASIPKKLPSGKSDIQEINHTLKHFFAMDEDTLIGFIKNQQKQIDELKEANKTS